MATIQFAARYGESERIHGLEIQSPRCDKRTAQKNTKLRMHWVVNEQGKLEMHWSIQQERVLTKESIHKE
jgi:hypothetical protein